MKNGILIDSSCRIKNTSQYKGLFLVPLIIAKEDNNQIEVHENLKTEVF